MQMVGPYILKLKVGPVQMHHLCRGKSATAYPSATLIFTFEKENIRSSIETRYIYCR